MLYNDEIFLNDKEFLRLLDLEQEKELFAKIVSLDFNENPLEEIEGRVTQGSVNVDGNSSLRRTCSLSLVASELNIHDFYWGLNTKFKLLVGTKNVLKQRQPYQNIYKDYPDICWFKMGTYVISSFSTSQSTNQYTISISGKDKMVFLNGEVGGVITPLSWDFGKIDEINADGMITTKNYLLKDIILEAVHEHAHEPYWNIIINDLDDYGLELLEYRGQEPLYLLNNITQGTVEYMSFSLPTNFTGNLTPSQINFDHRITYLNTNDCIVDNRSFFYHPDDVKNQTPIDKRQIYTIIEVQYGDVIGYRTTDLTYAGDLISNVGEAVTSMLDKIVSMLGAYEYFYDLNGRFVFQRKKTYVQSSLSTITQNDSKTNEIFINNAAETSACTYSFDNSLLVTSFANAPNLADLKNDFSIWGIRKGVSGIDVPVHLRYAIDTKPWIYIAYDKHIYITPEGQDKYNTLINKYIEWIKQLRIQALKESGKIIFTKNPTPDFLSSDWWDIANWADYYYLLTGTYPDSYLKDYGTQGFVGTLTFPDGSTRSFSGRGQLIIDLNSITYNPFYSNPEGGYFDVRRKEYRSNNWSPFQHGFDGCYHTYTEFLDFNKKNQCQSFIYKPMLPEAILTDEIISNINNIIIDTENMQLDQSMVIECDWREIIYQMSLDYNRHHHDNDFLINIDNNNTLPDGTHLYLNGYTGYENYYIDLNGFWRELYDPFYKCSFEVVAPNKSKYNTYRDEGLYGRYFIYQSCTNVSYYNMKQAVEDWKDICGEVLYYYNYKNQIIPCSSIPDEASYNKNQSKYCYVRGCKALYKNGHSYEALPFDNKTIYYERITDDYDPITHWSTVITEEPENLNFWFDFLDTEGQLGQYKVCKIGDRTKANNDNNVKSIYFRDVPTVIFVDSNTTIAKEKAKKGTGYTYIRLPEHYENLFSMSSQGKSAMNVLDEWLYSYACCTESITLNTIPIYYLEPNTRIFVRDDNSGINGEYIVTKLTFPLTHNGTMSITATKAVENLY